LKRAIPIGWKSVVLSKITERVCVGFVGKCQPYFCSKNEGVPLIRTGNLSLNGLDTKSLKYVNHEFHKKNKKSQLTFGDILVARHGDSGLSSIYYKKEPANCLNIVVVKPEKNSTYSSEFIYLVLKSGSSISQIKSTSGGSVQGVVNTQSIANVCISVPLDENLQIQFNDMILPIYKKIHNLRNQSQKLSELRDWILPMLMNGQVRVSGAEGVYFEGKDEGLGMVAEGEKYLK
jgi:type I restriction enzyme S subunit